MRVDLVHAHHVLALLFRVARGLVGFYAGADTHPLLWAAIELCHRDAPGRTLVLSDTLRRDNELRAYRHRACLAIAFCREQPVPQRYLDGLARSGTDLQQRLPARLHDTPDFMGTNLAVRSEERR